VHRAQFHEVIAARTWISLLRTTLMILLQSARALLKQAHSLVHDFALQRFKELMHSSAKSVPKELCEGS